jgi:cell division protein FtsI/penicillin-binding protein 2
VGTEGNGLEGAELTFNGYLRGENGWSIIQRNARNVRFSRIDMPQKLPENGCDVYLTIDIQIQKIVESVLRESVAKSRAKGGMAIVMDPMTGNILAMANAPDYNPNTWRMYPADMRKNRCITDNYEPGSTFKIVVAASALQEGIFNERDTIDGNMGAYEVYGEKICDHEPYGKLSFSQALCYSSNVCFAKIANAVGNKRLDAFARDFGFGLQTGIALPGEELGIVHPVKEWSGRTRVTMAIGQEVSTTFLQMMTAYCTVANGGILLEPSICRQVVNAGGDVVMTRKK